MENNRLIALHQLCEVYEIEVSFVQSLDEYGLIEILHLQNGDFIEEERLSEIEKLMRLHYDLEINMAGLDVITRLLQRLHETEQDLYRLKNKSE